MKNWHQDNAYFRLTPSKIMASHVIACNSHYHKLLTNSRECGLPWTKPRVKMDGIIIAMQLKKALMLSIFLQYAHVA